MTSAIDKVLKKLKLEDTGRYDDDFYIITLKDSNDYAKMYTQLDSLAVNTEFPTLDFNTSKTMTKTTNYFEIDVENIVYNIFLVADFAHDSYYIKIGEK